MKRFFWLLIILPSFAFAQTAQYAKIVGGNTTGSFLILQGTTANPTAGLPAVIILTGNAGADTAMIIQSDGTITADTLIINGVLKTNRIEYDSTYWDDTQVPALSIKTGATAPAMTAGFAGNNSFELPYFQGGSSTNDQCWFTIQLSHRYKEGSDIYPHLHWAPTTNVVSGSDTVVWELIYTWATMDSLYSSGDTIITKCAPGANRQWYHELNSFAAINGTGQKVSSIIICRLRRLDADASDTYTGSAAFLGFDIHFEIDSPGSKTEIIK